MVLRRAVVVVLLSAAGLSGCVVVETPVEQPAGEQPVGTAPPTLEEVPDLPAEADPPSEVEAEIEQRVLTLANEARRAEGLGAFERHDGLDGVARRWSQYLARQEAELAHNPGFSDQVPEGWAATGENVGWIDGGGRLDAEEVATRVHEGWMDSPGHRENLLREEYTHLGVGVAHSEDNGYYLTQNFAAY